MPEDARALVADLAVSAPRAAARGYRLAPAGRRFARAGAKLYGDDNNYAWARPPPPALLAPGALALVGAFEDRHAVAACAVFCRLTLGGAASVHVAMDARQKRPPDWLADGGFARDAVTGSLRAEKKTLFIREPREFHVYSRAAAAGETLDLGPSGALDGLPGRDALPYVLFVVPRAAADAGGGGGGGGGLSLIHI